MLGLLQDRPLRGSKLQQIISESSRPWVSHALLFMALVLAASEVPAAAGEIAGTIARVVSGDTLIIADGAVNREVRLADIGAPQGSAYYAPAAKTLLSNMVAGKPVRIVVTGSGGTNRSFGRVFVGELDVNLEMVRRGAAWVCLEYAADTGLLPYENDARRYRRGLWSHTWQIDTRVDCRRRPPAERSLAGP